MSPFEILSVALSFVLGLAVMLLLMSFLNVFRARRRTRMSWVPVTAMVAGFLVVGSVANATLFGLEWLGRMNQVNLVGLGIAATALHAAGVGGRSARARRLH